MEYLRMTNRDSNFYSFMGKYLANRKVAQELGMPVWDDDEKEWIIVIENNRCIAFSAYVIKSKRAYLKSSWVTPEYRGKGIYANLFDTRIKILSSLKSIEGIATAMSKGTYVRHGFELVGMKGKYYHFRKVL